MKLLIDAGNTRIKWALVNDTTRRAQADKDEWLRSGVLPVGQADALPQQFADVHDIQQIWVSNVAGETVAQHIRNIKTGHVQFHRGAGNSNVVCATAIPIRANSAATDGRP